MPKPEDTRSQPTAIARVSRALLAPPPLVEASLARMEAALGGREALVAALSQAPKSRDLDYVLGLIGDPINRGLPLGLICAQGGITAGELLQAWKSGLLATGHLLATKQIVEGLPAVVAETMKRAAPYQDDCHGCQGLGMVTPEPTKKVPNPEPQQCPVCRGSGRLEYPGDLDHKKLVYELAGMVSKGGGISMTVDARQAHLHGGGGEAAGGTLERMLAASDAILYGDGVGGSLPPAEPAAGLVEGTIVDSSAEADPADPDAPDPSAD